MAEFLNCSDYGTPGMAVPTLCTHSPPNLIYKLDSKRLKFYPDDVLKSETYV